MQLQPLLESFESFLYVLVNTLPVGIGIGLVFFAIGFLLTNPRVKRYRAQIDHYKEEIARMSRMQEKISSQHQELLEGIQDREDANLALQTSLETKDEELIGLLERLNNVAANIHTSGTHSASSTFASSNVQQLRDQVAELTARLQTAEAALGERNVELANVGAHETAAASPSADSRWTPLPAHISPNPHPDSPQQPSPQAHESSAATLDRGNGDESGAQGLFSLGDPDAHVDFDTPKDQPAGTTTSHPEKTSEEKDTDELESHLAEFEERLRKKEAEFFALQDQFSFANFDPLGKHNPPPSQGHTPANAAPLEESPSAQTTTAPATAPETDLPPSPFPPLENSSPPPLPKTIPHEQIIFRGSDPSLWGKAAPDILRPSEVGDDMNYLRLKRCDTGQSIIISLTADNLLASPSVEQSIGWNGKSETFEGAYHLGIFDHSLPQEVETRFGAGGWGFGHFYGKRAGQAFSWAGITIPETEFEISALSKLPDSKSLLDSDAVLLEEPSVAPSQDETLVFFHSAYPEIWNKNVADGNGGFALNVCRTPLDTRFVRVRRVDNGKAVIIPVTREQLVQKNEDKESLGWNGSNELFFGGYHLGICNPKAANRVEIIYGCGGYGFGHLVDENESQAFAWAGKSIPRTAFEFTAIARNLTPEEKKQLLKC